MSIRSFDGGFPLLLRLAVLDLNLIHFDFYLVQIRRITWLLQSLLVYRLTLDSKRSHERSVLWKLAVLRIELVLVIHLLWEALLDLKLAEVLGQGSGRLNPRISGQYDMTVGLFLGGVEQAGILTFLWSSVTLVGCNSSLHLSLWSDYGVVLALTPRSVLSLQELSGQSCQGVGILTLVHQWSMGNVGSQRILGILG